MITLRKLTAKFWDRKFSPAEAAAMLDISVTQANNLFDEVAPLGIVEKGNGKRSIEYRGLFTLLMEEQLAAWQLAKDLRLKALAQALAKNTKRVEPIPELSVLVSGYRERAQKGLSTLYEAEENVETSKEIMQGEPCIRGTRVPVYVLAAVAAKHGIEEVQQTYPFLTRSNLEHAILYAKAHPRKGRPKTTMLPSKPIDATRKVIVRNNKARAQSSDFPD